MTIRVPIIFFLLLESILLAGIIPSVTSYSKLPLSPLDGDTYLNEETGSWLRWNIAHNRWIVLGTYSKYLNVRDFGAKGDGISDDSDAVLAAIAKANQGSNGTVFFPAGTYRIAITITRAKINLQGVGQKTIIEAAYAGGSAITYKDFARSHYGPVYITDMEIRGKNKTADGLRVEEAAFSPICKRVIFRDCDYGYKRIDGWWANFEDCSFLSNNYGSYHNAGSYEGGVWLDSYNNCYFKGNTISGFTYDNSASYTPSMAVILEHCYIEGNKGFGVFLRQAGNMESPFIIRSTWFEANGRVDSVTINGSHYKPRDLYADQSYVSLDANGQGICDFELVNGSTAVGSHMCLVGGNSPIVDSSSTFHFENVSADQASLLGGTVDRGWFYYPSRSIAYRTPKHRSTLTTGINNTVLNGSCTVASPFKNFHGLEAKIVQGDGLIGHGDTCVELNFTGETDQFAYFGPCPGSGNNYYVLTLAVKGVADDVQVTLNCAGYKSWGGGRTIIAPKDEWATYIMIDQYQENAGIYPGSFQLKAEYGSRLRVSAIQYVQFSTEQAAKNFAYSNIYAKSQEMD